MADGSTAARFLNLPASTTTFVGRQYEVESVREKLGTAQLLTITGPGGSGKTRLAREIASQCLPEFAEGVWCDLAAAADPAYVPASVAAALGLTQEPDRGATLDSLIERLLGRQTLLVLDNCEHLLLACAALAHAVLRGCPEVKILATSLQPLGLPQERVYMLPPLSLPADEQALPQSDAARLFVERAQEAFPGFRLGPDNAFAVMTICRRLDGLPLAIELAAARARLLSAEQIAQRLDNAFGLLTRGSTSQLPRHQTLGAAMDWSYGLLTEAEQLLLRRLSVFAGPFTVEMVEAVCSQGVVERPVLEGLFDLADKSLILMQPAAQGGVRIRLLETVRQYAREKLEESGEAAVVRTRLLDWALRFAAEAEPHLIGADQAAWLDRLEAEHNHFRAGLRWAIVSRAVAPGLRLIRDLWRFWMIRAFWSEGRAWCNELINLDQELRAADVSDGLRARAYYCAGTLAFRQNDVRSALARGEASLALAQMADDKLEQLNALNLIAVSVQQQGNLRRARELLEAALGLARALDNVATTATLLNNLGALAHDTGDYDNARTFYEESLAIGRRQQWGNPVIELYNLGELARLQGDDVSAGALLEEALTVSERTGDIFSQAGALAELGRLARNAGDLAAAERRFRQALELREKHGEHRRLTYSLCDLGDVARDHGHHARAQEHYERALSRAQQLDDAWGMARALHGLGVLAFMQERWDEAAKALRESIRNYHGVQEPYELIGALEELAGVLAHRGKPEVPARWLAVCAARRAAMSAPVPPPERVRCEKTIQSVRAALGEAAYEAIQAEAKGVPLEHILREALGAAPEAASMTTVSVPPTPEPRLRLSALGAVRVLAGGHLVASSEWKYSKAKELLFYLLEHAQASKAQIGLDLWPDASPERLRNIFHRALYQLRRALGASEWIIFEEEQYAFNRAWPFEYDVDDFEAHLRQAQRELRAGAAGQAPAIEHLETAAQLWQGDFLADLDVGEWAVIRREALRQSWLDALLQLGQLHVADARYPAAAEVYQRVLSFDPYLEMGHRQLMRCHARRGEMGWAMRQYQTLRELLRKDLHSEPSPETTLLYERLRRGDSV